MTERNTGIGRDNQQLIRQSDGVDRFNQRWEDLPHDELVGMMRATLDDEKAHWEAKWGEGSFDPVTWLGERLSIKTALKDDPEGKKLSLAWDALTLPYIKDHEQKMIVAGFVRDGSQKYGGFLTLPPKGVKLIDAMAEAIGVSRPRGTNTIALTTNTPTRLRYV